MKLYAISYNTESKKVNCFTHKVFHIEYGILLITNTLPDFIVTRINKIIRERNEVFVIFFKESEKNRYLKVLKEKIQDIEKVSQI